jgi:hypothetical protein
MGRVSFILSLPLIFSFSSFSYEVDLSGHLRKQSNSAYTRVQNIEIFVKGDGKFLGRTTTNKKGDFELFFLTNAEKEFRFYAVYLKQDTIFLKSVVRFQNQQPEITFYLPKHKVSR